MNTYTIDSENNIVAGAVAGENAQQFSSQKELGKLAAEWPMSRLAEIWNSFAGVAPFDDLKPVKKFQTRDVAVSRIWAAISRLDKAKSPEPEPESEATTAATPKAGKKQPVKASKKDARKKRAPEAPKAGLVYEREYKGKTYHLTSADKDGKVVYRLRGGDDYDSLTAAAKAVTEYPSISGPAFWGEGSKAAAR